MRQRDVAVAAGAGLVRVPLPSSGIAGRGRAVARQAGDAGLGVAAEAVTADLVVALVTLHEALGPFASRRAR